MYRIPSPHSSCAYKTCEPVVFLDLPSPDVIEDWIKREKTRREKERQPEYPAQIPLQLPIPPCEAPKHDNTNEKDNGGRGVVIIDLLAGRSLDNLLEADLM